jgi:hypothetical protein
MKQLLNWSIMDQTESVTHSFVVRIWREENDRPLWRGSITHVPSGHKRYVQELGEIAAFIARYLDKMDLDATKSETAKSLGQNNMGEGRQHE